jgi:exosortase D (VPLPA-CTERM-specific)
MAYREGNVIDLGPIQLQVVEACSGLRYLFPLAALALICAYLFKDQMWKRVLLFLSSFPIAIFLNGFRIGITGILVDLYGVGPAEGFFHSFSGWILFASALAILFAETWLLGRIGDGGRHRSLREMICLEDRRYELLSADHAQRGATILVSAPSYFCAVGLLIFVIIVSTQFVDREETLPQRQPFFDFPMKVGSWEGRSSVMDKKYVETLRFDDYLLADYRTPDSPSVNFYIAYYNSQKKGQSAHSPKTCIPGGGWEITSFQSMMIDETDPIGNPLMVNRVTIQKGDNKQVVLYWFQQRGRMLTNEYLVKFYLFWDALTRNRTDGALIRLTAMVPPGMSEDSVAKPLATFARTVFPLLAKYIPG